MPGVARAGDIWSGICCCHNDPDCISMSGPIVSFSADVIGNGRGAARLGDSVIGNCGHPGNIVTASPNVICNGRGLARLGDVVVGCTIGQIVTCSGDINAN